MTSTTLFSDVVLPAATWYEKHDLNTTDMHPFIHAFTPAINPPWQTRTDFDAFHGIAKAFSDARRPAPRRAQGPGRRAAAARHPRRAGHARRRGAGLEDRRGARGARRARCRSSSWWSATTARSREKMAALGPLLDRLGTTTKAVTVDVNPEIELPAADQRHGPRRRRRRPAPAGHRHPRLRGDPRAVRHHQRPGRHRRVPVPGTAHRAAAGRPGRRARGQADPLRRHPVPAGAGHHQPGVVGQRARRPALLAVHHQRRAAQAVAHADRPAALLPRPRLDAGAGRGAAGVPAAAGHAQALRRTAAGPQRRAGADRALPDPALEVVDPLRVPGQPHHADAVARRPDDVDERDRTRRRSAWPTTTGSRRSTATASWSAGPW